MEEVLKALMKTPINGARLSSPFGMRKHPIDNLIKCIEEQILLHRPALQLWLRDRVFKKQDGVVGGNCVVIKHNSTYQTIYAHMSKFAKGIKEELE